MNFESPQLNSEPTQEPSSEKPSKLKGALRKIGLGAVLFGAGVGANELRQEHNPIKQIDNATEQIAHDTKKMINEAENGPSVTSFGKELDSMIMHRETQPENLERISSLVGENNSKEKDAKRVKEIEKVLGQSENLK